MKNLELKFIASLLYLTCNVGDAGAWETSMCPGHEGLLTSENVLTTCKWNMPESTQECTDLVQELSNLASPTTQQRYDLAFAIHVLADFADREGTIELLDRAGVMFRALYQELPNDTSLLFWRYLYSNEDEKHGILLRIVQAASDCSEGRNFLLKRLGFATDYLDDPDIPEDVRAEISHQISVGYDLAVRKNWKMRFGAMMFDSLMVAGRAERAKPLQKRIFVELDVANLKYDDASRTENLRTICNFPAFRLRFTKHCLDAIERSLARDVGLGGPLGDDILLAIKALGIVLAPADREHTFDEFSHPADAEDYDFDEMPFFPGEAVEYAIRLGDMIRGIPVELQTIELHRANRILSRNEEKGMLEKMLRLDPDNEEVRNALQYY